MKRNSVPCLVGVVVLLGFSSGCLDSVIGREVVRGSGRVSEESHRFSGITGVQLATSGRATLDIGPPWSGCCPRTSSRPAFRPGSGRRWSSRPTSGRPTGGSATRNRCRSRPHDNLHDVPASIARRRELATRTGGQLLTESVLLSVADRARRILYPDRLPPAAVPADSLHAHGEGDRVHRAVETQRPADGAGRPRPSARSTVRPRSDSAPPATCPWIGIEADRSVDVRLPGSRTRRMVRAVDPGGRSIEAGAVDVRVGSSGTCRWTSSGRSGRPGRSAIRQLGRRQSIRCRCCASNRPAACPPRQSRGEAISSQRGRLPRRIACAARGPGDGIVAGLALSSSGDLRPSRPATRSRRGRSRLSSSGDATAPALRRNGSRSDSAAPAT